MSTVLDKRERDATLGFLFGDIARMRVLIYDRKVAHLGLTFPQVMALGHSLRHGTMTQSALAQRMDLGAVTISGLIDRLEQKGWVSRRSDDRDRRAKLVEATAKVEEVREEMGQHLADLNDLSLDGLSDESIDDMINSLKTVRRNLRSFSEKKIS